ncbi:hypothetical protein GRI68_00820 [Altererythrobacter halimionae]|uniref:Periplasmic heavy metal sensor n=2 Tax=Alteriqipengyuania halimionae TaxID=1926630 RepID=A0A6I4U1E4_9SPHN|nr:hypothetical protein [Alteriqipengyuania halimionae]
MKRVYPLILLMTTLAACASPRGEYPSLAIRDGERMGGSAESAPPAPPAPRQPLSTDIDTRVKQLRELGKANHQEFADVEARAARLVSAARGTPITSKANASAQIALAELQSAHDATLAVLAELDVLLAEATIADALMQDIAEARNELAAITSDELARLAKLGGNLSNR